MLTVPFSHRRPGRRRSRRRRRQSRAPGRSSSSTRSGSVLADGVRRAVHRGGHLAAVPRPADAQGGVRRRADDPGRDHRVVSLAAVRRGAAARPLRGRGPLAAAARAGAPGVPRAQRLRAAAGLARPARSTAPIDAASKAPPLSTFAAMVAFLLLGARRWPGCCPAPAVPPRVAARPERGPRPTRRSPRAELRARAERALAEGRNAEAVVDGFRALDRAPGRARPARRPARRHRPRGRRRPRRRRTPTSAQRVDGSAALFDAVRYGDRPATRDQAADVLALDDALAGRR